MMRDLPGLEGESVSEQRKAITLAEYYALLMRNWDKWAITDGQTIEVEVTKPLGIYRPRGAKAVKVEPEDADGRS